MIVDDRSMILQGQRDARIACVASALDRASRHHPQISSVVNFSWTIGQSPSAMSYVASCGCRVMPHQARNTRSVRAPRSDVMPIMSRT